MPDSPVDHSLTSEAAAGASAGSIPRSSNNFYSFFFGSVIIHERIQHYNYHRVQRVKGARTSSGARAAPVARDISQKLN